MANVNENSFIDIISGLPRLLPGLEVKSRKDRFFNEVSFSVGDLFYTAVATANSSDFKLIRYNQKPQFFWRNAKNGFDVSFGDSDTFKSEITERINQLPVPEQPQKDLTEVKDFTE